MENYMNQEKNNKNFNKDSKAMLIAIIVIFAIAIVALVAYIIVNEKKSNASGNAGDRAYDASQYSNLQNIVVNQNTNYGQTQSDLNTTNQLQNLSQFQNYENTQNFEPVLPNEQQNLAKQNSVVLPNRPQTIENNPDDNCENENNRTFSIPGPVYKPIIYLYPQKDEIVNVKLGRPNELTVSYPKYTTGWNVLARPNSDLYDLSNGRKLYSLYYESLPKKAINFGNNGFVVKDVDTTTFLEEKLAKLGLSEREAEEFIVYWLPILQNNKYNFIHFATTEEVNKVMPLSITTKDGRKPDTMIRVLMCYKPLNAPINVSEQKIVTPQRKGFVAVEWGGTKLNGNLIK